jgi:predicted alpha/beta-fold hydrolase
LSTPAPAGGSATDCPAHSASDRAVDWTAPRWLPGAHLQTIVPARLLPLPRVAYRREIWDTPDGDHIAVDVAPGRTAEETPARVVVLFHGLEGDSDSHYSRLLVPAFVAQGWQALVVHFRGCGGLENRLPRAYHSGDTAEVAWVLGRVRERWPRAQRHAVGISLGGNALARWAGEQGAGARALLASAASVCAPLDLRAGGLALERGFNRFYARMFLDSLRPKALRIVARHPGLADPIRIAASRTIRDFDDAFTAPVHGFAGVFDYWARASARPLLGGVDLPLLLINARNDPFVPRESLPGHAEVSASVRLEQPEHGGHVGFRGRAAEPWPLRARLVSFFGQGG